MVEQGCTTCWLTTTADNWRAQPLYYSLGFEVLDCSVSFCKQLKEATPKLPFLVMPDQSSKT